MAVQGDIWPRRGGIPFVSAGHRIANATSIAHIRIANAYQHSTYSYRISHRECTVAHPMSVPDTA
eukprot:1203418-Rhodomonas_salina.4